MKALVMWSGGKDSQACLIHSIQKYGKQHVRAVFCDTGWEHQDTLHHVEHIASELDVELVTLRGELDFEQLVVKNKLFPGFMRRYCTHELKVKPFVDYLLTQDDSFIVVQGIRGAESPQRARYEAECDYFKPWHLGKARYRKNDVLAYAKTHDVSISRPIFKWSAQEVVDYILDSGLPINPLYKKGMSRVGCYPCVFANKSDLKQMAKDKQYVKRLIDLEDKVNAVRAKVYGDKYENTATFFSKGRIPKHLCITNENGAPTAREVFDYFTLSDCTVGLFEDAEEASLSCMSVYHGLCE